MNAVALLIVGVVILIVLYFVPRPPAPLWIIGNILGWCCVAIGGILIILGLLGIVVGPLAMGRLT